MGIFIAMLFLAGARAAFLMPTKELDGLAAMLFAAICLVLASRAGSWNELIGKARRIIKISFPLLLLVGYAYTLALLKPDSSPSAVSFLFWILFGYCCFVVAYYVFSSELQVPHEMLILLLLMPGIFHLIVYGYDLCLAYMQDKIIVADYIKDIPRVGRKHLSIALMELLAMSLATINMQTRRRYPVLALWLIALSLAALASLDTRGAYFSILVLLVCGTASKSLRGALKKTLLKFSPNPKLAVFFIVVGIFVSLLAAEKAGSQRWSIFIPSIKAVYATYSGGKSDSDYIRWATPGYWDSYPEGDKLWCHKTRLSEVDWKSLPEEYRFRCEVDVSIYLRAEWIKFGLVTIAKAPFGMGISQYSLQDGLARTFPELNARGELYQHAEFHSALLDLVVCLGIPGLILIGAFFVPIVLQGFRNFRFDSGNLILLVVLLTLLSTLARLVVDGMNEGLWYYLMAITGMSAGLSHER